MTSILKHVNPHILNLTQEQFRRERLSPAEQPYDKIVVYALDSGVPATATNPKILLLKRAEHEIYFPGVFELPSGKVEVTDPTIKHALLREMKEETGREVRISKTCIQLNSVVSVSDGEVKILMNIQRARGPGKRSWTSWRSPVR
ncbi:hypothetical protein AJ80_01830 [Polytolypa hystricis UAMH7299]|uniref:Nudix hydrolase domain-containing protein n=1 Tax=Polytolypa hystricis (strain UAMH7299) TaxID=1447883 RepID=A0A2B7YXX2_POLH7|nr:hypothetical protein AJ80_01830 [Polytolypa hystricis UAMH7299]